MTTSDAAGRRLGLAVINKKERMYVVYDVEKFAVALVTYLAPFGGKKGTSPMQKKQAFQNMSSSVVAFMSTKQRPGKQWDAAEVKASAAEKGWGPMIYDIVMAMEGGLMADRDTVKPGARKVWGHYYNNRDDVRSMPLDDETDPVTDETGDDAKSLYAGYDSENPLDYAYFANNFPLTSALSANHEAGIRATGASQAEYEDALLDFADEFFERRYLDG